MQAVERVRPGGAVVYSTCSIEPEENQQVVRAVLQALPDLSWRRSRTQVPGRPADGGYWARLRRRGVKRVGMMSSPWNESNPSRGAGSC